MAPPDRELSALEADWLGFCRRAAAGVRAMLEAHPQSSDRLTTAGFGEGGDMSLVIDRAAEEAVFLELESLGAAVTAVSEERGEVAVAGGGPVHVVIDPIDGSLNAKRGLPLYSLSIAVAAGDRMGDVELGFVYDLGREEEWWARRGEGAFTGDARLPPLDRDAALELLGVEGANPRLVAAAADALADSVADRLRVIGSIALTLCFVAAGRLDGMLSLGPCRSVDAAAGQLIVREAGGVVSFPDVEADPLGASLSLDMRSRVLAANGPATLDSLVEQVSDRA